GERDDGDLGRPAPDVDDHVAARLGDGQARADGGRHGLFDEVDLARPGALGAFLDGALLDLGDAEGDADDDARLDERAPVVGPRDEVPKHRLGHLEVGDDAIAQRANRLDVAGGPAEHLLRVAPDGQHALTAARVALDGHDRGLAGDDPFALDVDERRGGTEIDRQIVGEQAVEPVEDHPRYRSEPPRVKAPKGSGNVPGFTPPSGDAFLATEG